MTGFIYKAYVTEEQGLVIINNYGDCKSIPTPWLTFKKLNKIKKNLIGMPEEKAYEFLKELESKAIANFYSDLLSDY